LKQKTQEKKEKEEKEKKWTWNRSQELCPIKPIR
jgi:hypothetical protein